MLTRKKLPSSFLFFFPSWTFPLFSSFFSVCVNSVFVPSFPIILLCHDSTSVWRNVTIRRTHRTPRFFFRTAYPTCSNFDCTCAFRLTCAFIAPQTGLFTPHGFRPSLCVRAAVEMDGWRLWSPLPGKKVGKRPGFCRSGAGILAAGGLHRHLCLPQLVTHSCCCGNSHFDRPTPTPQQNGPGLRDLAMSPVAEVGEGTMKSLPSLNVDFREGKHSRLLIWEVFLAQAMSRRAYKQASADSFFFFTVGGKRLR